jgi:hypothetical protein
MKARKGAESFSSENIIYENFDNIEAERNISLAGIDVQPSSSSITYRTDHVQIRRDATLRNVCLSYING